MKFRCNLKAISKVITTYIYCQRAKLLKIAEGNIPACTFTVTRRISEDSDGLSTLSLKNINLMFKSKCTRKFINTAIGFVLDAKILTIEPTTNMTIETMTFLKKIKIVYNN